MPRSRSWVGVLLLFASGVSAAGYREAPFVAENPKVDGSDLFVFRSYEPGRSDFVTLIANYQPLQDAFAGPGYFAMDPDAIYEIHVDNDGDGVEDLSFRFDFDNALANLGLGRTLPVGPAGNTREIAVAQVALGAITGLGSQNLNHLETFGVQIIRGDRRAGVVEVVTAADSGAAVFEKPLDFVGTTTVPDYGAYADAHVFDIDIPGCTPPVGTSARLFVGQRAEPSAMNLGQWSDLINFDLDPGTAQANFLGPQDQGANVLQGKSVTSLAMEIPAACLVGATPVIGVWTTASLRQARVLNPTATFAQPTREGGPWVQVSRVGMPLVNDVVIGLPDKDRYNGAEPRDDDSLFADYFAFPTWPEIMELQFGGFGVGAPENFPREDLVGIFASGLAGVNATDVDSEMLRLNTATPATASAAQDSLGLLSCLTRAAAGATVNVDNPGCDLAGFPNGRRPGDDVVDVTMRLLMGFAAPTASAPSGGLPFVDGAFVAPAAFLPAFPYLNDPRPGAP